MVKIFTYRGKTLEDLQKMDMKEFAALLPARQKRTLLRGLTDQQKILLKKIRDNKGSKKQIKTHVTDMIVLPEMVGAYLLLHTGKEWSVVIVMEEMVGHYLGEFRLTRKKVAHSAPGVGATRSSAGVSQK